MSKKNLHFKHFKKNFNFFIQRAFDLLKMEENNFISLVSNLVYYLYQNLYRAVSMVLSTGHGYKLLGNRKIKSR